MEKIYMYHYLPARKANSDDKTDSVFKIIDVSVELEIPWFIKARDDSEEMYRVLDDSWTNIPNKFRLEIPNKDENGELESKTSHYIQLEDVDGESVRFEQDSSFGHYGYYYLSRSKEATPSFIEKVRAFEAAKLDHLNQLLLDQSKKYDYIMSDTENLL